MRFRWIWISLVALVACVPAVAEPQPIVPPGPTVVVVASSRLSPTVTPPPTSAPRPSATPLPDSITYTVQAGDMLGAIAERFGVSLDLLVHANDLLDANTLAVGQVLIIPLNGTAPMATATVRLVKTALPVATAAAKPFAFSVLENYRAADYPLTRSGPLYTIHYQADSFTAANIDSIVEFVEHTRLHINQSLGVNYAQPFDVYLAGTLFAPPDMGLRGRAFSAQHVVFVLYDGSGTPAERRYMLTHELTHLIAWNAYGAPRSAMLSEGAAVYAGERFLLEESFLPIEVFCRAYQVAHQLPRVSSSQLTLEGHLLHLPAYYASGCFVKYLIRQYGTEKFGTLYHTLDYSGVYGKSLTALEEDWLAALQADQTELPISGVALVNAYTQVAAQYRAFFADLTAQTYSAARYAELDQRRVQVLQGKLP